MTFSRCFLERGLSTLATAVAVLAAPFLACAGSRAAPGEGTMEWGGSGDDAPAAPAWLDGAVCYQIFVRSFFDADGDGTGDLPGVIQKLDHLNDGDPSTTDDLGADVLILLPIFPALAYHGFDPIDFEVVSPEYGTAADLERLTHEAHARGMRVVLDLPINSTSARHRWFQRAWSDTSSYHDWYRFRSDNPGWTRPWDENREVWHAIGDSSYYHAVRSPQQPDLALENPEVLEAIVGVMETWLARGVDGFRVDVIRHLVETGPGAGQTDHPLSHRVLRELHAALRARAPEAALIGDAAGELGALVPYLGRAGAGAECDAITGRALAERLVRGVQVGGSAAIAQHLEMLARELPPGAVHAPVLSTHDEPRAASALDRAPERLANAAAILLTLPGAPTLLYGEEIGMADGDAPVGLAARLPLAWTKGPPQWGFTDSTAWAPFPPHAETANVETQRGREASLLAHYRRWIAARHASRALARGRLTLLSETSGRAQILCFLRDAPGERVLVAHNLGDRPGGFTAPIGGRRAVPVVRGPTVADPIRESGGWRIVLPPRQSGVWRIEESDS